MQAGHLSSEHPANTISLNKYPFWVPMLRKQYKWHEQIEWLNENVSIRDDLWTVKLHKFWFVEEEHAVLFALRFCNYENS
jgi:hypothetical protein